MKLTIDTQVDTQEDIKKVLFLLTSLLERNNNSAGLRSPVSNSSEAADTTALMSMFGEDSPAKEAVKDPNAPPDITSFFNAISEKEQKKNEPKIEYF